MTFAIVTDSFEKFTTKKGERTTQQAVCRNPCRRNNNEHLFFNEHLYNLPGRRALMPGPQSGASVHSTNST
jgi:hypothetical protein